VPFVDMVFDEPTGNAVQGILSIGKHDLSLRIPFALLVSNIIRTYETLGNKALFDCNYKLDCWPDCSQIVARFFCGAQPPMRDSV
jgi:hypothetical protein